MRHKSSTSEYKCPKCGSERVHRSHRRGFMEWTVGLTGLKARRCQACGIRFATLGTSSLLLKDIERVFKKALAGALAIVGAILVLVVVLWLTSKQAAFSPSESRALRISSEQVA